MADNNDKNKLRRKRVSSTNSSRSGQARSNREENKSKVRIKKQAGSGDNYYEESSNIEIGTIILEIKGHHIMKMIMMTTMTMMMNIMTMKKMVHQG